MFSKCILSSRFHYEVLVTKGFWQGSEKARTFEVAAPPFVLNETDSATVYSVAVRLVTLSGYHSILSEINTMETSECKLSELFFIGWKNKSQ